MRIIAGPCQIESVEQGVKIAEHCKDICDALGYDYYFKASFDKANRSHATGKRGLGFVLGTGAIVNIKKGQFLAPWDVTGILSKTGMERVLITERGTCFGYNNLVVDFTGLIYMINQYQKTHGVPIVFDATHSVQKPGGLGLSSGGNREYVPYLLRAAASVGV